jgi:hypothetical protein
VTAGTWEAVSGQPISLLARPGVGLWTPVIDYVTGPLILRIGAEGVWKPVESLPACTADGFKEWFFGRDWLLTKNAPLGALIGKIGGSNISTSDADIFLIGSYAVITVDNRTGPLYLTINDAPPFFSDNSGEIKVTIK